MSKIKLTGDTSGYVEISAPNVAANNTLELGGGTKILTNLDNVFTGVTTYSGNIDLNANLDLGDDNIVRLGTDNDLQIYHDGTNSNILNTTGELVVRDDSRVRIRTDQLVVNSGDNTESLIYAEKNGGVFLYHNASQKFVTTTTGATVTGTLVSGSVTSELDLTAISSSITRTATDIFVYDTRKDSDGGAWRKRTQHTSWYNETLNTSTRGSRKEFPAVAVIVAEQNFIRIYDGDDPDLPMWMVFNTIANGASQGMADRPMIQVQGVDKVVYALNGILATGTKNEGSNYGQPVINFISEKVLRMDSQGGEGGEWIGNIAQRNDAIGYRHVTYDYVIAASRVNDIAMTVLPNAPIDDATGLPVPTIAVATNGGVSIIKDDGTVVDITGTSQGSDAAIDMISFVGNDKIMYSHRYASEINAIVSSDVTAAYYNQTSTWLGRISNSISHAGTNVVAALSSDNNIESIALTETFAASKSVSGLSLANNYAIQNDPERKYCFITTDYNTGWMHGDIKGAFLSDTDTTNITGSNLIDNGDFGTGDFTNWSTSGTTTPTISSGGALLTTGAADGAIWQSTSGEATSGKWNISWTVTSNSGGFFGLYINNNGPNGSGGSLVQDSITTSGSYYYEGNITAVEFRHRGSSSGIIDNIVLVRVGDEDRSINNKGLQVHGTVTKSAVATGADLVAYSGFTDNDYLKQPYNSDLDFGTGDYYMSIWAKGGGNNQCLMIREHGVSSGNGLDADGAILIFQASGKYNFYSRQDGTATWTAFSANNATFGNYWSHVMLVRRGGTMYGYVNGNLEGSTSFAGNVSNNDAELFFGRRNPSVNNTQEYSGSLALARIGGSAPSPEQIKKMYEDEKVLFQENAKCTLYGSSDAVTALAYDDDTDLLHVGTSSGRSDFQGLRRINNTTTAVTTAISASDDLIAEQ